MTANKVVPPALGPYRQSVACGDFVFVSGQIGLIPSTGELAGNGAAPQARQALENLHAILETHGLNFDHVVKTVIYLADMRDFAAVNAVYAERFKKDFPARSTVAVAALPKGALVEIEVVAHGKEG